MKTITEYQEITAENINNNFDFTIPLDVFPNQLGINLCNVKGMEVIKQEDEQLVSVKIDFIPNNN